MKQTINLYQFREAFQNVRPDNFSHEGLKILFDCLEEYEDSTGEEMKLDVIALCCDFSEDTPEGIAANYGIDISEIDADDLMDYVYDWLSDNTIVCGKTDTTIVYQVF